jgi:hypothetical protein
VLHVSIGTFAAATMSEIPLVSATRRIPKGITSQNVFRVSGRRRG